MCCALRVVGWLWFVVRCASFVVLRWLLSAGCCSLIGKLLCIVRCVLCVCVLCAVCCVLVVRCALLVSGVCRCLVLGVCYCLLLLVAGVV